MTEEMEKPGTMVIDEIEFGLLENAYWRRASEAVAAWGRATLHPAHIGALRQEGARPRSYYRGLMLAGSLPLLIDFREKSILDLGCNQGFWSFEFGHWGAASLTGVDSNTTEVMKARLLSRMKNFPHFNFIQGDVIDFLKGDSEEVDLISILSLIYHLPANSDWEFFFAKISSLCRECVVIDSRWFDDSDYWQKITHIQESIPKWRPKRSDIASLLGNNWPQILEVAPAMLLSDQEKAKGDGDPYSLDNVADYVTNHRSLVIAFKQAHPFPPALRSCVTAWN